MSVCVYMCMCMCVCVYVVYTCVCLYMFVVCCVSFVSYICFVLSVVCGVGCVCGAYMCVSYSHHENIVRIGRIVCYCVLLCVMC